MGAQEIVIVCEILSVFIGFAGLVLEIWKR